MIKKYTNQNLTWIDAENPTKEEVDTLMADYKLDPEVAQEILLPTYKPKISAYHDYIYLVLHFPAFKHSHTEEHKQEIDFVIGKNFLISARYGTIDQIEKISKIFEVNAILEKSDLGGNAGHLFYFIMKELFKSLEDEIDFINDTLRQIEKKIFSGQEKAMVTDLSRSSRNLLDFKNTIENQNETIADLENVGHAFFEKKLSYALSNIVSEHYRIEQNIEKNINLLQELRETNNSLLSTKQNEIMKTLTIITFIMMPFSIITGLFQMDTTHAPVLGTNFDWYLIVAVEVIAVSIMFMIARGKKWF